ncbi:Acetyltransferase (GNAT) domain-containing protein [Monaibacterium marinum]|uniref:Acetyltransferase (GNAT) domain-containing protein n=1 Tax=Pontivivens marinum TaxID=1690039 RepID=A0A2C9CQ81_9RHOB|nr:GNAT family N-acetyltransferase [Monaibacterium marinum]SOH93422.1 Acetyltransferase (GNAT) domain-containing protein [Monaibacterium marinum]
MDIREVTAADVLALRQMVLRPGQGISAAMVRGDDSALHLGTYEGDLIGVASLFITDDTARLRKFAVHPDHQGRGIGSEMLRHMQNLLRARGVTQMWCDARVAATSLYARHGLQVVGEVFDKGGRDYLRMEGRL